jgi:hypothetical protein
VEAAADEVVHAARRHAVERAAHEIERAGAEQELDRRRGRKLRRAAEPAETLVVLCAQRPHRIAHDPFGERLARRPHLRAPLERGDE